jgi:DNA-binding protein HU-beta
MAKAATKASMKKSAARKATTTKAAAAKTAAKTSAKTAKKPAKAAATKVAAPATRRTAAKAATKAAATKSSPILTLRHIAEQVSTTFEVPKHQANEMLTHVVEQITKSLKKGDKIRLSGLGILQVRKRAARMGRNPRTGGPVKIKASKKIAFRAAKDLKDAI